MIFVREFTIGEMQYTSQRLTYSFSQFQQTLRKFVLYIFRVIISINPFYFQGNVKEPEPLPEKSTQFSDHVPNTNSGNYGNRVNTDIGTAMAKMEHQFYSDRRRKKLGSDMICY